MMTGMQSWISATSSLAVVVFTANEKRRAEPMHVLKPPQWRLAREPG
jgi:hypothetical protein